MATDRKDIIRQVNDAFSRNDLEAVFAFCSPEVRWDMVGQKLLNGFDEVRSFMGAAPGEPPAIAVDSILVEGDLACCNGSMELTETPGEAAQHYGFCDLYRFNGDDRITEIRSYIVRLRSGAGH